MVEMDQALRNWDVVYSAEVYMDKERRQKGRKRKEEVEKVEWVMREKLSGEAFSSVEMDYTAVTVYITGSDDNFSDLGSRQRVLGWAVLCKTKEFWVVCGVGCGAGDGFPAFVVCFRVFVKMFTFLPFGTLFGLFCSNTFLRT